MRAETALISNLLLDVTEGFTSKCMCFMNVPGVGDYPRLLAVVKIERSVPPFIMSLPGVTVAHTSSGLANSYH